MRELAVLVNLKQLQGIIRAFLDRETAFG